MKEEPPPPPPHGQDVLNSHGAQDQRKGKGAPRMPEERVTSASAGDPAVLSEAKEQLRGASYTWSATAHSRDGNGAGLGK